MEVLLGVVVVVAGASFFVTSLKKSSLITPS